MSSLSYQNPHQEDTKYDFIPTFEKAGFSRYARAFSDPRSLAIFNDLVAQFQKGESHV